MGSPLKIGHLILIFALAALPFAATFALYYPDERHYTDGALMMLKHGDWLLPHTGAGVPRFEKPVLAYWAVAASWLIFGINVLAARLPFLLAGCGTLWLTYRLARKLTGNDRTALLAAVILAAHPQFFLCSIRSMPDALLVFFVTLSAFGFLRLIAFNESTPGAFWMAYGGAAGAVLSKGLLGAGIVLFAWGFAFWKQRDWRAVKKLIHPPSLVTSIVLAAGWFVCILWLQGKAALVIFFGDQVTGNMHGHFWSPALRVPLFALALAVNFLPWSVAAGELLARKKSAAVEGLPGRAQQFILAWTALLVVGFALGQNVSLRYLLPATPLMAVLLAGWLHNEETAGLIFSVRRILKATLALLLLMVGMALVIGFAWRLPVFMTALTGAALVAGVFLLGIAALRKKRFPGTEALGLALLFAWPVFFTMAMPVLLPDRAQQIAAALRNGPNNQAGPVLLVGDVKLASRLRVLLGQDWTVVQMGKLNPADMTHFMRILISECDTGAFAARGWKIRAVATGNGVPPRAELWDALKSRTLPEAMARQGKEICLATPE